MTNESPSNSLSLGTIPTEERVAFIDMAAARSSSISSPCRSQRNARPTRYIPSPSKRKFPRGVNANSEPDIEDLGCTQKKKKSTAPDQSFYLRYRKRKGLFVTDITDTEWCPKQMEFDLRRREKKTSSKAVVEADIKEVEDEEERPKQMEFHPRRRWKKTSTKAMRAGIARHKELEDEVVKRVMINVESVEDEWAIKFINFIAGVDQLLNEGLTRELPVIGFVHGVWITGVIDEIIMPKGENRNPILVDTKTRESDNLPSEPQKREGRLQLMCYKLLWDSLVAEMFPAKDFFNFFSLNPNKTLSKDIRTSAAAEGVPAKTLSDIVRYLGNTCSTLLPADHQMILRYEAQKDKSLLGEVKFGYEPDWLKAQIDSCLELWVHGEEANFTPEGERWKCRRCRFSLDCPANSKVSSSSSPLENAADKINSGESSPNSSNI